MTATEIAAFQDTLPDACRPTDGPSLAERLVEARKITQYQASAIFEGKTDGLVFGEYRIVDKIGEGGMGIVLKAEHQLMGRVVAVKVLSSAALRSPNVVQRFYREVKAAARLNHPNIVAAYDAGHYQGNHFLVMEYVEGQSLADRVRQRGPLPLGEALGYILQAARGLQYSHAQGIVHRDIKPANLLVDREGTLKILDMGLARLIDAKEDPETEGLTRTGLVMGTCEYMAPEQAVDSHRADHRADIYSLGCTLYRLLTGEAPYPSDSVMSALLAHREARIPSLRQIRPGLPARLDLVFRRMLAKRPSDRYQSMAEVIDALQGVLRLPSVQRSSGLFAHGRGVVRWLSTLCGWRTRHAGTTSRPTAHPKQDEHTISFDSERGCKPPS